MVRTAGSSNDQRVATNGDVREDNVSNEDTSWVLRSLAVEIYSLVLLWDFSTGELTQNVARST